MRHFLSATKTYDPRYFAVVRILLGAYLAYYFLALLPYAPGIYATGGILPPFDANPLMAIVPFLAFPLSPLLVQILIAALAILATLFALGIVRIPAALLLCLVSTMLYIRNPLTEDPSMAFINLLLLFTALVPEGEGWSLVHTRRADWYMPRMVYVGAWIVLEIAYSASGIDRLLAPSWQDGTALRHLFTLTIDFNTPLTHFVQSLPGAVLAALTYGVSIAFLAAVPLCIYGKTRPYAWLLYMVMFLVVGSIINLTEVILGVLIYQLFLFDIEWVRTGPFTGVYRYGRHVWKTYAPR